MNKEEIEKIIKLRDKLEYITWQLNGLKIDYYDICNEINQLLKN